MSALDAKQRTRGERAELLGIATTAALEAATLIRARAPAAASLEWRAKGPADFVSDVDEAAERIIRAVLEREVPGAFVLGEEMSPDMDVGHGVAFVVDPLDGTTNFLHGYPAYSVSIAALVKGRLAAGVIVNVPTGDLYTATAEGGAARNGEPLEVSTITEPPLALIGTGFPYRDLGQLDRYQRQFAAITRGAGGLRRAGSAALDLADVAGGRFDGFWELRLSPWDYAAGTLLVREAGGRVTDLAGDDLPFTPSAVVAGNPTMHAWLLDILNEP